MPSGGNTEPISIEGDNAEWKKAQKKPKKSIISDTINNKNPSFNPNFTA
jgi:ribosomal protein L25 (general stress protein Ctc)